ncbi:mitochondrial 2-oxodicarboxylate carrier isoform X2 [Lycorma delicatula]|uniref:mitochondrial 2-oxodicarboxylate carrier isoform X2 n=1 Tax=Lycorma delicatula TaxID=130591 RepID=UPI003F510260
MIEKEQSRIAAVKSYLKEMAIQVVSGGSAGFVEVCIMHPLDLIKTRLQVQSKTVKTVNDPHFYNGIFDCVAKMYRHEGFLAFYKGILPPILAETPKRAIKFMTFEQYKQLFMFGAPSPTPLTYSLAGISLGITEAIFVNPFEVVKVSLQSNHALAKEAPSSWAVTRQIIAAEGISGINKGLSATVARNGLYNMVYFGFNFSVRGWLPVLEDPLQEFLKKFSVGFTSGVLGSLVNIPFDVAKSRIQGPQPIPGQIKYKNTVKTIILVYKEEGKNSVNKTVKQDITKRGPLLLFVLLSKFG